MGSALETHIRALAPAGLRLHLWPTKQGYQANVADAGGQSWTCDTQSDPIAAISAALRIRATLRDHRPVVATGEGWDSEQLDIEQAIAAAASQADAFEDMLG